MKKVQKKKKNSNFGKFKNGNNFKKVCFSDNLQKTSCF